MDARKEACLQMIVQSSMPAHLWQGSRRPFAELVALALFLAGITSVHGQWDWLERVDESLHVQFPNGSFRTDLSGLLDLEGYYIDQLPPGLIYGNDDAFINPRLSLFLDTRLGEHLYSFVQARVDRGFDPREQVRDARADEYLLRYLPFADARLSIQAGKFATVFGNWVPRHDSWQNPFVTEPLPYGNFTPITDQSAPDSRQAFLARRNRPLQKDVWVPIIWGPSYASGAAIFGTLAKLDYAFEVKNAALSSRVDFWDGADQGWEHPTFTGRIGTRINPAWNIGASLSYGSYLAPPADPTLDPGTGRGDFRQITIGQDVSFVWHHWQVVAEAIEARFEVPRVGNADTISYYLEAKCKLTPRLFAALRWNQQLYGTVPDEQGLPAQWGQDIWRIESALGYRFSRHLQAKLQYGYSGMNSPRQEGEQLLAAQLTLKF